MLFGAHRRPVLRYGDASVALACQQVTRRKLLNTLKDGLWIGDISKSQVLAYRAPIDGPRAKVWWKDPDFRAAAFYYLRVAQEVEPGLSMRYGKLPVNPFPSEMAWTSPVWVARK